MGYLTAATLFFVTGATSLTFALTSLSGHHKDMAWMLFIYFAMAFVLSLFLGYSQRHLADKA